MLKIQAHIFGGGGGIGRWLADRIFSKMQPTYCYDLSPKHLDLLSDSIRRCPLDGLGIADYKDNFRVGDWVILAVPQPALQNTVSELVQALPPEVLLVVATSTQKGSLKLLQQHLPFSCDYLGFHPLFSHAVGNPMGQTAVLTDFNEAKQSHQEFIKAIASTGLFVTPLSAETHDQYMALIQALTNFCLIGFAATIGSSGIPPSNLRNLKTPNFQLLYSFACRVLKSTNTTTGSIQFTPEARAIRESFLSSLEILHEKLSSSQTVADCAQVIDEMRAPLSGAEIEEGAEESAAAVDALQHFEKLLHRYKIFKRPFVFRHRIKDVVHIVRIKEITHDEIHCLESTKKFMDEDGNLKEIAIGLLDKTRAYFRQVGINLPPPKKIKFCKRDIKLLTPEELRTFYKEKVKPISKTVELLNLRGVKEDYVEELLPLAIKGLWKCDFVECYRKRGGIEKLLVTVRANPNIDIEEVIEQVRLAVEEGEIISSSRGSSA
ncbi:MAG: prephenate dehydrogenase/arogenate dehydrogenase family protein [Deltaproteobacteria bacterium]|nr:prephenate dehydrogenase/arogenate dehydrogenase family protein [Deltaproteobacteria bacterium]